MTRSLAIRWKRVLLVVVLGLGVAGLAAFVRARPVELETVPVERGPVVREAIGSGTLESEAVVQVAFTLPGRLAEVRFQEGERVGAGEVLATLDAEQESHRVEVARRNVTLASHRIRRSAAEIDRAEAVFEAARTDHERTERLVRDGAMSEAALDASRERLARAEAELEAATVAKREGASGLAVARAGLALDASRSEETIVRSPFEGVIVRRHREPGDVLAPGEVVLTVASTSKVWARTWLDEAVLHELREGQAARVVLRGDADRSYRARVDRISVEADRETHEVLVDLELLERPERLIFGRRLDGFVELERVDSALRAPRGVCDERQERCHVAREGRVESAPVALGLRGTRFVEIREGLDEGATLVVPPADGSPVPTGKRLRGSRE